LSRFSVLALRDLDDGLSNKNDLGDGCGFCDYAWGNAWIWFMGIISFIKPSFYCGKPYGLIAYWWYFGVSGWTSWMNEVLPANNWLIYAWFNCWFVEIGASPCCR
jgi:hypothetical protein